MAKIQVVKGATSVLCRVFFQDSSSTTGAGLTGINATSAGLVCYRARDDDGNAGGTAISLSAATRGTWSSGGFVEKDSTNMPGIYEFGIPNAALVTGTRTTDIMFKGATNLAPNVMEIELTGSDNQDGVHFGLTSLPNVAAGGNGGLPLGDANGSVSCRGNIKKNAALSNFMFLMTDSTNHNPKTGLSPLPTCTRSLDAGAFAGGTLANVAEVAFGWYKVDFLQADMNANLVVLRATASGCDDTFIDIPTIL